MKIQLTKLAHARSGDKGDTANIGLIALRDDFYLLLVRNVTAARVYLRHFDDDYTRMNVVYAGYFPPSRLPARTCIGVSGLARGARIEIDMIARRG